MEHVQHIIDQIEQILQKRYEDPRLCTQYAWWILEKLVQHTSAELLAAHDITLTEIERTSLHNWLSQLVEQAMPLPYLIGSVPFNGVDILIEPPVLIPRPETEEWTVKLIEHLRKLSNAEISILDMCTGSGCIAIALAKAFPMATIIATDIADEAIACALKNCKHNSVTNIKVIKSDLFESIPNYHFDLIVGNPPYLTEQAWQTADPSVKNWEDKNALVGSIDGLSILKKIIIQARSFIKPNTHLQALELPQLVLEIDCTQGLQIQNFLKQAGYCDIRIGKDMEGRDRVAYARMVSCGSLEK